ncbi:MAG: DUF1329 domain-containing protein [Pseudomonadales bacterium]|nr:DUF1329 domain-containing protein [Pseudomonadales bacterium]
MKNSPFSHAKWARHFLSNTILASLMATLFVLSATTIAAEDQSYQALRDWIDNSRPGPQAIEAGRHLTEKDRVSVLESLIPHSAWKYYIFDGMDMEVATTGHYPAPDDWGKSVASDYALDEEGTLVGFTGGGFPFPIIEADDKLAAQKVIWNMLWRPGKGDYVMPMVTWLRSEGGKLDRVMEFTATNTTFAHGDHSLIPGYEEVKSKSVSEFRSPRDMAGFKNLSIEYIDHHKENSGWIYMPAQRKPRRSLASERTGEVNGKDSIREDSNGFGGKVYENDWTYLGKRKVLATINVRTNPEFGGPHQWVPHNARWEVRDAHVLLIQPKTKNHPYSGRIVFVDAETYWTHWMFAFDKKDDQLLRMNQHFLKYSEYYDIEPPEQAPFFKQDYSKSLGAQVFLHLGQTDIHAKKPHASLTHCYTNRREYTAARAKQVFSLRNMASGRR